MVNNKHYMLLFFIILIILSLLIHINYKNTLFEFYDPNHPLFNYHNLTFNEKSAAINTLVDNKISGYITSFSSEISDLGVNPPLSSCDTDKCKVIEKILQLRGLYDVKNTELANMNIPLHILNIDSNDTVGYGELTSTCANLITRVKDNLKMVLGTGRLYTDHLLFEGKEHSLRHFIATVFGSISNSGGVSMELENSILGMKISAQDVANAEAIEQEAENCNDIWTSDIPTGTREARINNANTKGCSIKCVDTYEDDNTIYYIRDLLVGCSDQ